MNFLKSLFCKHEYKYYYKERVYGTWRSIPDLKFSFVCPKCQKIISIKDTDIDEVYEEYKREVALQQALGADETQTMSFHIPYAVRFGNTHIHMSGPAAYKTKEHFLRMGIDITQLKDEENKRKGIR